jgi:phenylpropionate dioxygenase-like ring-hydroxylating dioxygenase large terminal subunit
MPDALSPRPASLPGWTGDLTRVPYRVYRDHALMKVEQDRVFEGPVWNFLCLENEIANPGDWRTTVVGQMPVVVARDATGRSPRSRTAARIAAP